MTDKVQKIKEYLVGMAGAACCDAKTKKVIKANILPFIDSLQEEPVSGCKIIPKPIECYSSCKDCPFSTKPVNKVYSFKAIPRLLEMIQPSDRAKFYATKLAERLESEGYHVDSTIVRESIKIMNGEKIAMATMDEEHASIDFEHELYKAFGQVKDFTLGMRIAKWFYDMGRNSKDSQEPVSDDLEEAAKEWLAPQLDNSYAGYGETKMMELTHFDGYAMLDAIEFGAKWQKQQDQSTIELAEDHAMLAGMNKMKEEMMAKAIDARCFGFQGAALFSFKLPADNYLVGSEVKVIIIKED